MSCIARRESPAASGDVIRRIPHKIDSLRPARFSEFSREPFRPINRHRRVGDFVVAVRQGKIDLLLPGCERRILRSGLFVGWNEFRSTLIPRSLQTARRAGVSHA